MTKAKTKGESSTTAKIKELTGKNPENIDEQELATIQSMIKTIDQLTAEIGQIEVRKHALLKAMESVQTRVEGQRVKFQDKYGTDNINIQTGVIAYPPEEDENQNQTPNPEENPTQNIQENGETDKED